MKVTQLGRWLTGILLASVLVAGGSGSALAQSAPAVLAQPEAALYDQTNNAGSNFADSTDWGTHFRTSNSQAADDFVVPAGVFWRITSATASGAIVGADGAGLSSLLVQFYTNSASSLPATRIFSQTVPSGSISGLGTGVFVVTLAPALTLGPGHYWFSVQDKLVQCSTTNCKHWAWTERAAQSNVASVTQYPLKDPSFQCLAWQPRVTVCQNPSSEVSTGKDLLFKLDGTSFPIVASINLPLVVR